MTQDSKRLLALAVAAAIGVPSAAYATNGMNLEGYGPIATGMGGASMAYDNGTAAVMNNPATLGLMEGSRIDVAIGELRPDVNASVSMPGFSKDWSSGGDSYLMPAIGWATNNGTLTYGVGVFAQGGMGTEYPDGGPGATFSSFGNAFPGMEQGFTGAGTLDPAVAGQLGSLEERSEVGVARVIFPVAARINPNLTVGGSVDFVRATMDVKMVMTGAAFGNLVADNRVSGDLFNSLGAAVQGGVISDVYAAALDFSDSSDFNGEATGTGWAGKLGLTYQVTPQLRVGASYHTETSLSDLEGDATMSMAIEAGANGAALGLSPGDDAIVPLSGSVKVRDFQWPTTFGIGVAYQANDRLMLVGDIKQIKWSDVMKDFKVTFEADGNAANGGFANQSIDIAMAQNWDDQTVIQLGAAYSVNEALVVRAGYNQASNPVPNDTVNYLFPAIVEQHYTVGVGYAFSEANEVNFSVAYAPEKKVTGDGADNAGLEVTHSQTNWQLMYSHRF